MLILAEEMGICVGSVSGGLVKFWQHKGAGVCLLEGRNVFETEYSFQLFVGFCVYLFLNCKVRVWNG